MASDFATILGFVVLITIKVLASLPTQTEPLLIIKSCGHHVCGFIFFHRSPLSAVLRE